MSAPWGSDRQRLAHLGLGGLAAGAGRRHAPGLQHVVALGRPQGEAHVLLHEEHGEPAAAGQREDRLLDLGDDRRLDALGRLVEQQQPRPGDQRAGDRELLALAAGEQPGRGAT